MLPHYPPFSKRFVRDNGIWARTFTRDNVDLDVGVRSRRSPSPASGWPTATEHEFDVIIYGTGFEASKFLTPMTVHGRGGVDLHETWDGEARAYLGITIPSFPNLFLMYGPNTNIVINGSIIYFSELEARYIVESVRMLLESRRTSMDVRADVHDDVQRARSTRPTPAWPGARRR